MGESASTSWQSMQLIASSAFALPSQSAEMPVVYIA